MTPRLPLFWLLRVLRLVFAVHFRFSAILINWLIFGIRFFVAPMHPLPFLRHDSHPIIAIPSVFLTFLTGLFRSLFVIPSPSLSLFFLFRAFRALFVTDFAVIR